MKNIQIILIGVVVIIMLICFYYFNNINSKKSNNVDIVRNEISLNNEKQIEYDNTYDLLRQEAETNGYINLSNYPGLLERTIKIDKNIDPNERDTPMYIYEHGRLGVYYPNVDHYLMAFKAITGNPIDTFYSSISGNDIV
jgi:hypothetical protein